MPHDTDARPLAVRHGAATHVFLWTAFPLLGAAAGWLLTRVPGWVTSIPGAPEMQKLDFLASLTANPVVAAVVIVAGAVAGGVVTLRAYDDIVTVEVGPAVTISRSGTARTFAREAVHAVFVDGDHLVLLGARTEELAREKTDHAPARLREAFTAKGYPWLDDDPHRDAFQRWADGMPGLDGHAQALLRARQDALKAKDAADAGELRTELARHGVVVRDVEARQYWRTVL